jgi:hypothetical protein
MRRLNRFAPVSGAPSSLIDLASGYFMLSAALVALLTLLRPLLWPTALAGLSGTQVMLGMAVSLGWAAAMFWTGMLLGRGSRRGGYLAFAFTLLSLISLPTGTSLVFTALSLIVLGSIWKDLK